MSYFVLNYYNDFILHKLPLIIMIMNVMFNGLQTLICLRIAYVKLAILWHTSYSVLSSIFYREILLIVIILLILLFI